MFFIWPNNRNSSYFSFAKFLTRLKRHKNCYTVSKLNSKVQNWSRNIGNNLFPSLLFQEFRLDFWWLLFSWTFTPCLRAPAPTRCLLTWRSHPSQTTQAGEARQSWPELRGAVQPKPPRQQLSRPARLFRHEISSLSCAGLTASPGHRWDLHVPRGKFAKHRWLGLLLDVEALWLLTCKKTDKEKKKASGPFHNDTCLRNLFLHLKGNKTPGLRDGQRAVWSYGKRIWSPLLSPAPGGRLPPAGVCFHRWSGNAKFRAWPLTERWAFTHNNCCYFFFFYSVGRVQRRETLQLSIYYKHVWRLLVWPRGSLERWQMR